VDVGANYGVYTVAAALAVGPSGRVWAFEPTPRCIEYLRRTLELNGASGVTVIPAAVSDRSGEVHFAMTRYPELNSIVSGDMPSPDAVAVPSLSLDDAAARHALCDVDFLKLDVEGHETQVIKGAEKFLAANSPLVMFEIKAEGKTDLGGARLLASMGYEMYRLLPGPLMLVPFRIGEALDSSLLNVFACKPERAERLAAEGVLAKAEGGRSIEQPPVDGWLDYARSTAYAQEWGAKWRSRAGFLGGGAQKEYFRGLAAYAQYRRSEYDSRTRYALLSLAFDSVARAVEAEASLSKQITFARLAWELGRRDSALDVLRLAGQRLESEWEQTQSEPFLAPGARYDAVLPAGRPGDWLRCSVIEQAEKLRAFSSIFVRDTTADFIFPILSLPFHSPEMDRRWQLVRMAGGKQASPQATGALATLSQENLNPGYWCGKRE
jgi:FkbM family methyltransferase